MAQRGTSPEQAEPTLQAKEEDAAPHSISEEEDKKAIADYFRWRPLPWWVCFFGGIFLLTKFQLVYNDSPCAVLGTQSPVDQSDIKSAFRKLSLCTHPDRLRGRLKRDPTSAELRRGEILFNRASAAKDLIMKTLQSKKKKKGGKIPCYEGELELAVLNFFAECGRVMATLGVTDYFTMLREFAWNICTFESGFFNTCLMFFWLLFIFRVTKQFFVYMWRMGLLRSILGVVTTIVIGPLPTLINFICLPVVRLVAFLKQATARIEDLSPRKSPTAASFAGLDESAAAKKDDDLGSPERSSENAPAHPSTAGMAVAKDGPSRLRQRKNKKETDEEKERRNKELLAGNDVAPTSNQREDPTFGAGNMPEGVWACINWGHKEPLKARQKAAEAVQFDLLLILTKPIIPLCMLIAMGQVFNGLLSSIFIGSFLRRCVPQMSYEAHHLLCSLFGVMHTLLGVSASQVEDYASREGSHLLHLSWGWSFKDVLAVMHMCLLGSTVTAMASLGNEPSYAASFAAGIALRIALAQDQAKEMSIIKIGGQKVEALLRDLGVQLEAAEEVVTSSGHGIGDCGGGPYRMLMGSEEMAQWVARLLKVWLMLLPLLAAMHWCKRTWDAGKMLGKRNKTLRFVQRLILFSLGVLQCYMILNMELNASNGALVNFWVAMLFGCVGESFLSTYDIRGTVRHLIFLGLFLLI